MLTAAIASSDATSSAQLLASLQQVGMMSHIQQWTVHPDKQPEVTGVIPDVVILDLGRDPAPYFALGRASSQAATHGASDRVLSVFPPDQYLLMDAMRSGVQEFHRQAHSAGGIAGDSEPLQEGHPQKRASEKLIVLMGAKGGVGTTTVAVNLGAQLCTFR